MEGAALHPSDATWDVGTRMEDFAEGDGFAHSPDRGSALRATGVADPVLATQCSDRHAGLMLCQVRTICSSGKRPRLMFRCSQWPARTLRRLRVASIGPPSRKGVAILAGPVRRRKRELFNGHGKCPRAAARRSAAPTRHVGGGPGLVDKDQAPPVELGLPAQPRAWSSSPALLAALRVLV